MKKLTQKKLDKMLDLHQEGLKNSAEDLLADFTGMDLSNLDFEGSNISHANFTDADLSCANLIGVDVSDCNFTNTNLFKADLHRADLFQANLTKANLYKSRLSEADFRYTILTDACLGQAKLYRTDFSNCCGKKVFRLQFSELEAYALDNYITLDDINHGIGTWLSDYKKICKNKSYRSKEEIKVFGDFIKLVNKVFKGE